MGVEGRGGGGGFTMESCVSYGRPECRLEGYGGGR